MSVQLIGNRVAIEPFEASNKTSGGIFLPEESKQKVTKGFVRYVGPGSKVDGQWDPCPVKPGDTVLFDQYAGSPISVTGHDKDLIVMRDTDIIGILED
ncbi:MAG: co-chaperone GroES [Legionellales bacterium]|nr:co-chaperone GroES [Legionellales bacterium]